MRSLVTGATGFLGSHLVQALLARGDEVLAAVRPGSDRAALVKQGARCVDAPLGDPVALARAAHGVDRLYHCAALASDYGPWADFEATNVAGTAHVLEAARRAGVGRLVHVSTTDVYGYPDQPVDETAPMVVRGWPYGDTKIQAERLVWRAWREHGQPVAVIRPANIWGPRSTTFVLEILELLRQGAMLHLDGGRHPAGLCWVGNVVDAMLLAGEHPAAVGEAFNVTDGAPTTWAEYVGALARIAGVREPWLRLPREVAMPVATLLERSWRGLGLRSRPVLTPMAVALLATRQDFCVDKLRNVLGHRPRVGFDEGMAQVEAWLRASGRLP